MGYSIPEDCEVNPRCLPPSKQFLEWIAHDLASRSFRRAKRYVCDEPRVAQCYRPENNGGVAATRISLSHNGLVVLVCTAVPEETHIWVSSLGNFSRYVTREVPATARYRELLIRGLEPTPGCPCCAGAMATSGNNLLVRYPEVAAHWNQERNGNLTPDLFLPSSGARVHWRDPASRRTTRAAIVSRTQHGKLGTNRQDCGLAATEARNLALCYPEVSALLVGDQGGRPVDALTVSPHSNRSMWWQCAVDPSHRWQAPVYSVVRAWELGRSGCGPCFSRVSGQQTAFFEEFARRHPEFATVFQTHGFFPDECDLPGTRYGFDAAVPQHRIFIEWDGWYWHRNRIQQDRQKNRAARKAGYRVLRVRLGLPRISHLDLVVEREPDLFAAVDRLARHLRRLTSNSDVGLPKRRAHEVSRSASLEVQHALGRMWKPGRPVKS